MSSQITVKQIENTHRTFRVRGTIALSGSYTQQSGGGEVLNFGTATYPLGEVLPVSKQPTNMDIWGNAGYSYLPFGALGGAGLTVPISIKTASAGGPTVTELSAGAYPASITGDTIQFEAIFDKFA